MTDASIIQIIQLCIGSGGLIGIFYLIFKIGKICQTVEIISNYVTKIKTDVNSIEKRLSHLEGAFEERGRWESRKVN
jgi:hypothetical protein